MSFGHSPTRAVVAAAPSGCPFDAADVARKSRPLASTLAADRWLLAEVLAAFAAAPLLLFPRRISIVALALLPTMWLCRLIRRRDVVRGSWEAPFAGLLLMAIVSLYPSVDLSLSRPKLFGLVLGFYVFGLAVQHPWTWRVRRWLSWGLILAGLGVSAIGVVGGEWNPTKFRWLDSLYRHIPRLVTHVQTSFSSIQAGIHPNEIGGTIALLLPLAAALVLFERGRRVRVLALASAAMMAVVLVLSASRSGLAGAAAALGLLVLLRWPRLLFALPFGAAAAVAGVLTLGPARLAQSFAALDAASGSSGLGRLEVWSRALDMIQDFPFTGIGLNTFPVILNTYYPLFSTDPTATSLPHAHNLFLQTAVDLGVLGLMCFITLWALAGLGLARGWRAAASLAERAPLAGLAGGLLAHFIYSQTDAVALGAKPGVLLWVVLGAAVAAGGGPSVGAGAWGWTQWALFACACGFGAAISLLSLRMLPF